MPNVAQNNKRIAKNTVMLYIRMILVMLVNLYTSRVILQVLGVEDFGLYNVVGGVVVLFSFINNAMTVSIQRFLNFELGRNNIPGAQKVFSASLIIHIGIAVLFLILAETVGLWFLNKYINIPDGRETAANWVYQFTILTSLIGIIRTPYNSSIIAYEKMSAYAYISIIEVVLKLLIVFLVVVFSDRLIAYSALVAIVAILIFGSYAIYCTAKFPICKYKYHNDRQCYLSLINFSGWSLFGAVANVGANHGIGILMNIFFGVTVNAALGIAHQVNAAIYQFVSNFQTAFNPQIVKSYAAGDKQYFFNLILNTSRYSFYLLFFLALPVFICCEEAVTIWLGNVPEHVVSFCRLTIIFSLIDAWQGPLWVSAQATGKIRNYQLLMSILILSNLPITYILFKFFHVPEIALIVRVGINIVTSIARTLYLKHLYGFPILKYITSVILRSLGIMLLSAPVPVIIYTLCDNSMWIRLICTILSCFVFTALSIYGLGIDKNEKNIIKTYTKRIIHARAFKR